MVWRSHWVFILCMSFLPWAGLWSSMGSFLLQFDPCLFYGSADTSTMPLHCFYHVVIWVVLTRPPLGLSYTFPLLSSRCPVLVLGLFSYYFGLPWPISSIWSFLGPLHFFGHPWPIPLLHSHGFLLNLSSFPGPITTSFTNSFPWAHLAHFCLLSISYDTHGLPLGSFALFVAFLLFYRPVDHYSCHSGLMVFLFFPCPFLYCWASSCYWAFLPKWASTNIN